MVFNPTFWRSAFIMDSMRSLASLIDSAVGFEGESSCNMGETSGMSGIVSETASGMSERSCGIGKTATASSSDSKTVSGTSAASSMESETISGTSSMIPPSDFDASEIPSPRSSITASLFVIHSIATAIIGIASRIGRRDFLLRGVLRELFVCEL